MIHADPSGHDLFQPEPRLESIARVVLWYVVTLIDERPLQTVMTRIESPTCALGRNRSTLDRDKPQSRADHYEPPRPFCHSIRSALSGGQIASFGQTLR